MIFLETFKRKSLWRCSVVTKQEKNNVVRAFQKFLKKQVKYKAEGDTNLPRMYDCEKYAVAEGRDEKVPDRLSGIIFVDDLKDADAILKWNPAYYQIIVDLESMDIVKHKCRPRFPGDKWWSDD